MKKYLIPTIASALMIYVGVACGNTDSYIEKGDFEKAYSVAKNDNDVHKVAEKYLEFGNYQRAYEIASTEDKITILEENKATIAFRAVITAFDSELSEETKKTTDYTIKKAWYQSNDNAVVLNIDIRSGYEVYFLVKDNKISLACRDLTVYDELEKSDRDEYWTRIAIKLVIDESKSLDSDSVRRINQLRKSGELQSIKAVKTD